MSLLKRLWPSPDDDEAWTVVFCTRVRAPGRWQVEWHWLGNSIFGSEEAARQYAQKLQDGRSRLGDKEPTWAYARVSDARKVDRRVTAPQVERWAPGE